MPKPGKEDSQGGRWTSEEHALFIKGMEQFGRRWTKVADVVGTRTTIQVRSHAQKWEIKVAKDNGVSSGGVSSGLHGYGMPQPTVSVRPPSGNPAKRQREDEPPPAYGHDGYSGYYGGHYAPPSYHGGMPSYEGGGYQPPPHPHDPSSRGGGYGGPPGYPMDTAAYHAGLAQYTQGYGVEPGYGGGGSSGPGYGAGMVYSPHYYPPFSHYDPAYHTEAGGAAAAQQQQQQEQGSAGGASPTRETADQGGQENGDNKDESSEATALFVLQALKSGPAKRAADATDEPDSGGASEPTSMLDTSPLQYASSEEKDAPLLEARSSEEATVESTTAVEESVVF